MMKAEPDSYPRQIHAKFELGQQMDDDASLIIQNSQLLLLLLIFCVCGFVVGIYGVWVAYLYLHVKSTEYNL